MLRHITSQLKWNYGMIRTVKGAQYDGFVTVFESNCGLRWEQRSWNTINYCNYSTQKSSPDATSIPSASTASASMLPKINALISESNKLAPASRNIINSGKSLFRRQWEAFFNWYDEFSHTNEVRNAHKQVEDLQDKLNQAQQLRRDVSKELNDIRYELQMCFADQAKCQKSDPRYLELIRREIEISNKDKQKSEEFNLLDKAERDLFILMQAAVKTSHEKEKIHTNSAKYWSIVGSLAGALLGICGTAFSFYNRNDLLADINKEFVVIRGDTKSIAEQVQMLANEQKEFLRGQQQRDRELLEREARSNVATSVQKTYQSNESWIHWIARKTYVISAYRYFVPKTVN